MSYFIFTD